MTNVDRFGGKSLLDPAQGDDSPRCGSAIFSIFCSVFGVVKKVTKAFEAAQKKWNLKLKDEENEENEEVS